MAGVSEATAHPEKMEEIPSAAVVDGAGAVASLVPVKTNDDTRELPSDSSDVVEPVKQEQMEAPQRSKGKIALIMSALCVTGKSVKIAEYSLLIVVQDCRLSRRVRHGG